MIGSIHEQIELLPTLDTKHLLTVWSEHFRDPPPAKLRKELVVPILAYRIQEREFGGLSSSARRKLREIALPLKSSKRKKPESDSDPGSGTRLIRVWKGETHVVMVSADGFKYWGKDFTSLSAIAREITGARWSGPVFFGTKKAK